MSYTRVLRRATKNYVPKNEEDLAILEEALDWVEGAEKRIHELEKKVRK